MGVFLSWPVAALLAFKYKKHIEDTAMIAISMMIVIMLLPSLVFNIQVGVIVVLVFSLLALIWCLYALIACRKKFLEVILSPGGLVFFGLICFFAFTNLGRGLIGSDALDYWGCILKGYYNTNDLWCNPEAIHPGTMLLWAVFAEKTWIGYADSMALWSMDVLMISLVIPLLRFAKKDHTSLKAILLLGPILLIPISMWDKVYNTFLADGIIGLAVGAMAVSIYAYFSTEDKVYLFQIYSELYLITSTKRIGILLAGCMLAVFLFLLYKKGCCSKTYGEKLLISSTVIICPVLTYVLWSGFSILVTLPVMFALGSVVCVTLCNRWDNKISKIILAIGVLVALVVGLWLFKNILMGDDLSKSSTINYFKAILAEGTVYWGDSFKISLIKLMIIVLFPIFLMKKDNILLYWEYISLIVMLMVYVAALCVTYAVRIAPKNPGFGQYVPGIERYLLGCFWAIIMLISYWIMDYYIDNKKQLLSIAAVAVVVIMMTNLGTFSDYMLMHPRHVSFYGFENAGITLTKEDNVFLIQEAPMDVEYNVGASFTYDNYPASCSVKNEFSYTKDKTERIEPSEFSKILIDGGYNYIYIQSVYDDFADYYADMIDAEDIDVVSGSVFKVQKTDSQNVVLIPMTLE